MQSELEYKLKHMKHNHSDTSERVERGVTRAIAKWQEQFDRISQNASLSQEEAHKAYLMAEQAYLTSQKIDERQKQKVNAERRADAARYNTLKAQLPQD